MDHSAVIRSRRIELGLQDVEVARTVGISIHEYCDLEQHTAEFETAISMDTAKRICRALGLDLRSLMDLPASSHEYGTDVTQLIRRSRELQRLNQSQLADAIGFTEETIRSLESTPGFQGTLPIVVLGDLERALGLSEGTLIT